MIKNRYIGNYVHVELDHAIPNSGWVEPTWLNTARMLATIW